MTDKEKLIERIRKLLALANSPNENEAAAAMEKAQSLLAEHNLNMDEVAEKNATGPKVTVDSELKSHSRPWRRQLGTALAKLYFCDYFFSFTYETRKNGFGYQRWDKHNFVGAPHNVAVAKMMFDYLTKTVERLATESAKRVPAKERSRYVNAFQHGCAGRLRVRIWERYEAARKGTVKTDTGTNLPALANLYDQAQALIDPILQSIGVQTKANNRVRWTDQRGLADGDSAGRNVSLDGQIGARTADPSLSRAGSALLIGK
jgi:hypothetical protein